MENDGIINLDTDAAKQIGFISDRFHSYSYLWRIGNTIIISFILAKQKGYFCQLMKKIIENGFDFEIPTPSNRMREIAEKQGWNLYEKSDDVFGGVIEYFTNK